MKSCFQAGGYPDNLMKNKAVNEYFSKSTGSKSKRQEFKGAPLVITFHSMFKLIGQLLGTNLHMGQGIQEWFK